jgi:cholesterol oxidase
VITDVLGPGVLTSTSLPLLGVGRDVPDGTLYLRDGDEPESMLDSTWSTQTSMNYFDLMVRRMQQLSAHLHGSFVVNPTYRLLRRVITVHPLGGCPADTSVSTGVVDGYGRVHGVPGLRVCDGSVFPGPIGANPSLTIAAFARRVAQDMLAGTS